MLKPLIRVVSVEPNWSSCLHSELQNGDLRWLAGILTLKLENGKSVTAKRPTLFYEDLHRLAFEQLMRDQRKPEWLDSAESKPATFPRSEDDLAFDRAWEIARECSRLTNSGPIKYSVAAQNMIESIEAKTAFKNFESTLMYRRKFALDPLPISLADLERTLLYADQLWQYDEGITEEIAKEVTVAWIELTAKKASPEEFRELMMEILNKSTANEPRRRSPLPEAVRHEVWRRDQGRCVTCGSNEKLEFDHIIPFSLGGSDTARNLQLLCEGCNRRKKAKI